MIDPGETRYWIRKIPVLQKDDQRLLADMKAEIPFLIHYLIERKLSTTKQSRMWFTAQQIATPALKKVIRQNRNKLEVEIAQLLLAIADEKEAQEIRFCVGDVQDWLNRKGFRNHDTGGIRGILQNVWSLKPSPNSNVYTQYRISSDGSIYETTQKGRFYTLTIEVILKLNDSG